MSANNKPIKPNNIINTYSIMTTLTQQEIEQLQYTLSVYMFESGDRSEEWISLENKLITIRAELEYPYSDIDISLDDDDLPW